MKMCFSTSRLISADLRHQRCQLKCQFLVKGKATSNNLLGDLVTQKEALLVRFSRHIPDNKLFKEMGGNIHQLTCASSFCCDM